MNNFEASHLEQTEEQEPGIEMIDLEPSQPEDTLDKFKRDLAVQVEKRLPAKPFLFKHGKVQIAALAGMVLVGLIIVFSASGVFSLLRPHASRPSVSPSPIVPYVPLLQRNTLSCLVNTAWSPDNQRMAVLGYGVDCPQGTSLYLPGLVNIYDGHSAKLLTQVHPDSTILPLLKKQVPEFSYQQAAPVIYYQYILWSPDQHYLALLFVAIPFLDFDTTGTFRIDGVLLLGKDGKQQVFLHEEKLEVASLYSYLRWDVQRGAATVVQYHANTTNYQFTPTSASLSYYWDANNMLVPETQTGNVSTFASSPSPVGNPNGDSSFSTRQSGYILYVTQSGHSSLYIPGVYDWQSSFPAWSPDGHFLVNELVAGGLLEAPGQKLLSRPALQDLGVDQLPLFPVYDKALVQVLHILPSLAGTNGDTSIRISWRPDGRVLATYYPGHVDIYDCLSGRKLASLAPSLSPTSLNVVEDVLRWSPDGTHLLLSSRNWGPVQLWGPGQLPE